MVQIRTPLLFLCAAATVNAWVAVSPASVRSAASFALSSRTTTTIPLFSSTDVEKDKASETIVKKEELPYDYAVPEDAVIHIKPAAMRRLRELRAQQMKDDGAGNDVELSPYMVLRMGVRSGGCSGMSYVMDFADASSINADGTDDQVDTYEADKIQCVVDAKSMLYLYGLELDYSTELIGGGFRFYNPNAEESCGCGSSFGV